MEDIKSLESKIKHYAEKYYAGESEISDEEFDALCDKLRVLNPDSEVLKKTGWGYDPSRNTSGIKRLHLYNLTVGSLSKIKEFENIPSKYINDSTRISAKLDGLSVVSYYSEGKRVLALTRGNGTTGIDVTEKMSFISPETNELSFMFNGAVRGEVVISNKTWDTIKDKYKDNPSANPRNIASGLINRKEIITDLAYLDYVVYSVVAKEDPRDSYGIWSVNGDIFSLGFNLAPSISLNKSEWNQENLKEIYHKFCKEYPCDGLVFTAEPVEVEDKKLIYDQVAYKFQAESKIVKVNTVTYDVTRTGRLFPRIWFDPVELSGAVVQKCTGFNAQYIRDSKINVGSIIEVCRSNEVIPTCMRVVTPSEKGLIPESYGGYALEWDGADLRIKDYDDQSAYHYISTVADVDGAGPALYDQICSMIRVVTSEELVEFIKDLNNDFDRISSRIVSFFSGTATKKQVLEVLTRLSSPVDAKIFITACNIRGISSVQAENIVHNLPRVFDYIKTEQFTYCEALLREISGIGDKLVESISSKFSFIKSLLDAGVKILIGEFKSTTFKVAITGALSVKRSDFDKELADKGIIQSGNFKEIKYLITNTPDSTSSKMQNAKKYGVEIISEEDFRKLYLSR